MGQALSNNFLGAPKLTRTYDPTAGEIDLVAISASIGGLPCRWIEVYGAGTVVVTGTDGTDVTLPDGKPVGEAHLGQYVTLKTTGTCTSVKVCW